MILGLILPPYILTLEFKSKEELQLMPQTEEEHLELEMDEEDDAESERQMETNEVNEVGAILCLFFISLAFRRQLLTPLFSLFLLPFPYSFSR